MSQKPTVAVTLTEEDLWFITESITCNVPSEDERSPSEQKTYNKMVNAYHRVREKTK